MALLIARAAIHYRNKQRMSKHVIILLSVAALIGRKISQKKEVDEVKINRKVSVLFCLCRRLHRVFLHFMRISFRFDINETAQNFSASDCFNFKNVFKDDS